MDNDRGFALALLAPALICVLGLVGWPMVQIVTFSLVEGKGLNVLETAGRIWGLGNYVSVLTDSETWESVLTTLLYVVGSVAPAFVLGMLVALLLNQQFPLRRALRCLALLPWAAPGVLVSIIFLWLFDPSYGVVNYLLRVTGISNADIGWFTNEDTALIAVLIPSIWKSFPFFALTILGALQTIPEDLYEAADIDGANKLQSFFHVTWPGVRGPAILAIVLNSLWALREFDIIFATTGGGPFRATETLGIRAYTEAFSFFELGRASTLGVLTIAMALFFVLIARRPLQKEFF
ncbi:sugar ABC transporter permease [Bosea caraganae]|uniref:Sugar ABC transporter permease n=1 Tax=Bosea caraganae TaxID=2763117 RepID=A0A370KXW3_9HYPH|nr:sugar ABC transporter permease [Bosea caraganae]RDJ19810.1 sugar ABC transporter permease [Bosea caraganae]RDJ30050.1 sugar ABC transporter permease [Bosea caraganae]